MAECPRCGTGLRDSTICEQCGWVERSAVPTPVLEPPPDCSWIGRQGRCVLLATIWIDPYNTRDPKTGDHVRPGLCGWHFETTSMRRLGGNFDEFELWHTYKRRRYCTQFSHHDATYLWSALDGLRRHPSMRAVIQPCRQGDCWVWDTLEHEKWASPWTPPEAGGSLRSLAAGLVRKMSLPMLPKGA